MSEDLKDGGASNAIGSSSSLWVNTPQAQTLRTRGEPRAEIYGKCPAHWRVQEGPASVGDLESDTGVCGAKGHTRTREKAL